MGQLLAPSFTSSQQTQQALSHNVTMPARDKLLDEKQLAEAQARQDGNDASRKKEVIQAFSKTTLMLASLSQRENTTSGLGLHLLLKAQLVLVTSNLWAPRSLSCFPLAFCEPWRGTGLHQARSEMPLLQDKAGITGSR